MDDFIEDGCDVVCINLVDRTDASSVIEKAKSSDVPVIFYNRELVKEDLERWEKLYYVGADAFESGRMRGKSWWISAGRTFPPLIKTEMEFCSILCWKERRDIMILSAAACRLSRRLQKMAIRVKTADEIANWNRDQAGKRR